MKRQHIVRVLTTITVALLGTAFTACSPKPTAEVDCGFVQNVYGERVSWKTNQPIPLMVHSSFPSEMLPALEGAMKAWELTAGRPMFRMTSMNYSGPLAPRQDGASVIYWMSDWETDKMSEQARTSVYWLGDVMREADVRINSKNFTFYIDRPTHYDDVHLESLMIHELGHVLGLKHKDAAPSVMATYLSASTIRNQVSDSDKADLKCEY
jgi:hypothetical protein